MPISVGSGKSGIDPAMAPTIDHITDSNSPRAKVHQALPQPGEQFGGYRILRPLGTGGMGAVYEAVQVDTDRRVALKLFKHSLDSAEARRRFLREGRLAASINHPNSVYVFGTEEIGGTPVISMELVAGGTLQDRVKDQGELPIGVAVDAILQIIAGLEAAQKMGVLHRDIKPANCFVDNDGTVKIGDFGLSISTAPRGDTDITQVGTFLGTPAFASPEQLRGDELDVRSDIYSVGVTLYYLLTGRTPFKADHAGKLFATVLEQKPPALRLFRPDVPAALGSVVLHCLEKRPANRFRDYGQLHRALLPFASAAPSAATLGLRFLAHLIDGVVFLMPIALLLRLVTGEDMYWITAQSIADILYFGLLEGIWGQSPGKALCRLQVVRSNRSVPGILRASARAAIITLPEDVWNWVATLAAIESQVVLLGGLLATWIAITAMFTTARRRNGYAAMHDLLTGTRVVSRAAYQARTAVAQAGNSVTSTDAAPRIGPYHILQPLDQLENTAWLLGYDPLLLRYVWIRKLPIGTPPVEPKLRSLSRIGRLRWLTGRRSTTENWDAYEWPSGQPLVTLLANPRSWSEVRFWLLDLAEELAVAAVESTVPARLALDRVWIAADGRAKLLDFPGPGVVQAPNDAGQASPPAGDVTITRQFLKQIAACALEGRCMSTTETQSRLPMAPIPSSAREFLASLATIRDINIAIERLRELVQTPGDVSRARRLTLVLCCFLPSLPFALPFAAGLIIANPDDYKTYDHEAWMVTIWAFLFVCEGWLILTALMALLAALVTRGGLFLSALGLAVVRADGTPASRLRMICRLALAWFPVFTFPLCPLPLVWLLPGDTGNWPATIGWVIAAVVYLLLALYSALLPGRGIADRLAGTWLVPS